jgi:hypothetical protein
MRRTLGAVTLVIAGLLVAAGCGDGDGSDGVASLTDDEATSETTDGPGGGDGDVSEAEAEEAMLEFTECMREHGIDMPDPDTSGRGGGAIFIGPEERGASPDMDEFAAADEACRHLIEGVMGPGRDMTPEEEAEMQDQALAMAQCMREHGIDMPDPQFEDGGMMTQGLGGDIDPMSEEFQEAQEACAEEAGIEGGIFAGPGPGGGDERPAFGTEGSQDSEDSEDGERSEDSEGEE